MDHANVIPGLTSPGLTRRRTSEHFTYTPSQSTPDLTHGMNASSSTPFITSSSPRRMIPRNELELSRPSIVRAEKDGDDPNSPTSRRRPMPERTLTGTPTRLTRLFGSRSDRISPGPSRSLSRAKAQATDVSFARAVKHEARPLPSHLYQRGLLEGKYSDIDVIVFDTSYPLHRIVLDQTPFFASALSPPWLEASAREVRLHPEEIDPNITKSAFELALRRLYGHPDHAAEAAEASSLFATACWLEMTDLVDASVEHLLKQMLNTSLAATINLVTENYYGKAGDRLLHAAKAMLSRDGSEMPLKNWDTISSDVIRDIVGSDSFYVHTEWHRWNLARRLLNRKLKLLARDVCRRDDGALSTSQTPFRTRAKFEEGEATNQKTLDKPSSAADPGIWKTLYRHAELQPLFDLIENGIHYLHFDFEQLQKVRKACDVFGVQLVSRRILDDALWKGLELRQHILNAQESEDELGFTQVGQTVRSSPLSRPTESPIRTASSAESPNDDLEEDLEHARGVPHNHSSIEPRMTTDETQRFSIPNVDCNIVTGGVEPIVTLSTTVSDHGRSDIKGKSRTVPVNDEARSTTYTTYPPFRFSTEFPNPRHFKPNKRVYSQTFFYAGSAWNLYLQRNKNTGSRSSQLGVYLHRAKPSRADDQTFNSSSLSVDDRIWDLERQLQRLEARRDYDTRTTDRLQVNTSRQEPDTNAVDALFDSWTIPAIENNTTRLGSFVKSTNRKSTPPKETSTWARQQDEPPDNSASDDDSVLENIMPTSLSQGRPALPAYIDTRPVIKAYFKIYSPSRDGKMLSLYESQPDEFSFSQSWGWRSSSFFAEENHWKIDEVDVPEDTTWLPGLQEGRDEDDHGRQPVSPGHGEDEDTTTASTTRTSNVSGLAGGKLRFMVTIGLV